MVTAGIAARAGITPATVNHVLSRQEQQSIARYQTPGGLTGLIVRMMDLLVKLDPR